MAQAALLRLVNLLGSDTVSIYFAIRKPNLTRLLTKGYVVGSPNGLFEATLLASSDCMHKGFASALMYLSVSGRYSV
jgi:hypothetical protein